MTESAKPKREIPTKSEDFPLVPNTSRERDLVEKFKRIVAQHLGDVGDKTTEEFLDGVGLELWRATRRR